MDYLARIGLLSALMALASLAVAQTIAPRTTAEHDEIDRLYSWTDVEGQQRYTFAPPLPDRHLGTVKSHETLPPGELDPFSATGEQSGRHDPESRLSLEDRERLFFLEQWLKRVNSDTSIDVIQRRRESKAIRASIDAIMAKYE